MSQPALNVDVDAFLEQGYVKIPGAVPRSVAEQCADAFWQQLGVRPDEPSTWPGPVARASVDAPCVEQAATAPAVVAACDQLAGSGRWVPRRNVGLMVARFRHEDDPGDTGWHIEASFDPHGLPWPGSGEPWRTNVFTRDRALLLLYLFTEIGEDDAPTRIRSGSHLDVPAVLASAGHEGLDGNSASPLVDAASAHRPVALATGQPGDVYVCHPFLVHAAQTHRGQRSRLIAQPPVQLRGEYRLDESQEDHPPVEQAILRGLQRPTSAVSKHQ